VKFGLSCKEYALLENLLINLLKKRGAEIWIFGSRARGDHKKFSDIDVLYRLPEGTRLDLSELGQLKEGLEESELPYKVDIVDINELADSYRSKALKEKVGVD